MMRVTRGIKRVKIQNSKENSKRPNGFFHSLYPSTSQNSKENSKASLWSKALALLTIGANKIQKKIARQHPALRILARGRAGAQNSKENSKYLFSKLLAFAMFPKFRTKFKRK